MSDWTETDWPAIESLLDTLLEQEPERRGAWLQAHCADARIRRVVQDLLDGDERFARDIDGRTGVMLGKVLSDAAAGPLPSIPGYMIVRLIGEGGMGSVFLAERSVGEAVQRVALKRLRTSLYDPAERGRFECEQRILARLEHPSIARLIDAGIAPDGVPWFALEHVVGEPLTCHCDERRLGIEARLRLLIEICAGVQHAHQQLVVHRDLKPSNILVNADGHIKLLDFGIARWLDPDTGGNEATRTELRRLTPGYAAPEQFEGRVGVGSDVYALGVILVELLSGQKPPSAATPGVESWRATVTEPAAHARACSPRQLRRILGGELGSIARKALRSDPAQRYPSVQALADDLEAWLKGRPVAARRGDWRYRSLCFLRRHAAALLVLGAITATALLGLAYGLRQSERTRAQTEVAVSVRGVLEDILGPLSSGLPPAQRAKLESLLAQVETQLSAQSQAEPIVQFELLAVFARTYDRMGKQAKARAVAERLHAFALSHFGADDARSARALALRGRMRAVDPIPDEAVADMREAERRMRALGLEDRYLADVLDDLGVALTFRGEAASAVPKLEAALALRERLHGADALERAPILAHLAGTRAKLGDWDGSLQLYRQAWRISERHGDLLQAASHLQWVAWTECWTGRCRQSAEDFDHVLRLYDRLGSRDYAVPQFVLDRVCVAWTIVDETTRAQQACDEAVAVAERLYGADSRPHANARLHRARTLLQRGLLDQARAEMDAVRALRSSDGASPRSLMYVDRNRSDLQLVTGEFAAMRDGLLPAASGREFDGEPMSPMMLARLALACAHAPAPGCPDDLVARTEQQLAKPFHRHNQASIQAWLALARLDLLRMQPESALQRLAAAEDIRRREDVGMGDQHRLALQVAMLRGEAFAAQGDASAAQHALRQAQTGFAARWPAEHPYRRRVIIDLARIAAQPTGVVANAGAR